MCENRIILSATLTTAMHNKSTHRRGTMNDVAKRVREILEQNSSKSGEEIAQIVDREIEGIGATSKTEYDERKNDPSCPSGLALRKCWKLDHGDGTSSTWCDPWHCA